MKELHLFLMFLASFGFYYEVGGGEFSTSGMMVFVFMMSYMALSLYRYHCERILGVSRKVSICCGRILVSTVAIFFPIVVFGKGMMMGAGGVALLGLMYFLTLDLKGSITLNILDFFEGRTKDGGDLFLNYPPKDMLDVLIPLGALFVIMVLIFLVN